MARLVSGTILFFICVYPGTAAGLSCLYFSPDAEFEIADTVAVGKVTSAKMVSGSDSEFEVIFGVSETLKGRHRDEIALIGESSVWLNVNGYRTGFSYLIFLAENQVRVEICSPVWIMSPHLLKWYSDWREEHDR